MEVYLNIVQRCEKAVVFPLKWDDLFLAAYKYFKSVFFSCTNSFICFHLSCIEIMKETRNIHYFVKNNGFDICHWGFKLNAMRTC